VKGGDFWQEVDAFLDSKYVLPIVADKSFNEPASSISDKKTMLDVIMVNLHEIENKPSFKLPLLGGDYVRPTLDIVLMCLRGLPSDKRMRDKGGWYSDRSFKGELAAVGFENMYRVHAGYQIRVGYRAHGDFLKSLMQYYDIKK